MKIIRVILVLIVISSLFLMACGGGKKPKGPSAPKPVWQPDWYRTQGSSEYVYSYGMATNQSERGSISSATTQARADAALFLEVEVQAMMKDYFQEAGYGENAEITQLTEAVSKNVAKTTISGGLVTQSFTTAEGTGYKTWIQYGFPRDQVNRSLLDAAKKEEGAYNRLRASKSFAELEREMDKL